MTAAAAAAAEAGVVLQVGAETLESATFFLSIRRYACVSGIVSGNDVCVCIHRRIQILANIEIGEYYFASGRFTGAVYVHVCISLELQRDTLLATFSPRKILSNTDFFQSVHGVLFQTPL